MEKAYKIVTTCLFLFAAALCLLACSDIEPVTEADGITDTAADPAPDPCEGIDCGGNGRCAVVGGDTAVCMCDAGYHAEGLECVENVPGEECSGVTCSGHGTCVVVRNDPDYPFCACDEGYHNEGDTNCVPDEDGMTCGAGTHEEDGVCVPDDPGEGPCAGVTCSGHGTCVVMEGGTAWCECDPGYAPTSSGGIWDGPDMCALLPCLSNAECPEGEVCRQNGECGTIPAEECGPPAPEGGDSGMGETCGYHSVLACSEGLTCVAISIALQDTGEYTGTGGNCFRACDPCSPDCPAGEDCIKRADGDGGFCAGPEDSWAPFCGTNCYYGNCRPDNEEYAAYGGILEGGGVSSSADCASDEVCKATSRGVVGHSLRCFPGKFVGIGEVCGDDKYCEFPDSCLVYIGRGDFLTCNPHDHITYEAGCSTLPCPPGIDCFEGEYYSYCIKDGVLPYGRGCFEDRNCMDWLVCRLSGYGNRCLPPL